MNHFSLGFCNVGYSGLYIACGRRCRDRGSGPRARPWEGRPSAADMAGRAVGARAADLVLYNTPQDNIIDYTAPSTVISTRSLLKTFTLTLDPKEADLGANRRPSSDIAPRVDIRGGSTVCSEVGLFRIQGQCKSF